VESSTGFIFYPGSRVDHRSYAPLLREIAARGYFVVLAPMPLSLALFHVDAADQVLAKYPEIEHWAIGGHSLGGVAAAEYASNHPVIEGLVLWAAYPTNDSLREKNLEVLSLYGSNDGLLPPARIEASHALLPADTLFIEIEGGNHSQFGSYGSQPIDGPASIPPEEQWAQVIEATVVFLESLSTP
jgi:pimeloyl-ACP methyl ester carboxylesterase